MTKHEIIVQILIAYKVDDTRQLKSLDDICDNVARKMCDVTRKCDDLEGVEVEVKDTITHELSVSRCFGGRFIPHKKAGDDNAD